MLKKILIILAILILLTSIGFIYLNYTVLPTKIKSLVISRLQEETGKKVTLEKVQFNIFKGLVLKNLVIADETKNLFSLKEASCAFFIWPIFKKMIIIPSLKLSAPQIFLERRIDNTFNIQDLFIKRLAALEKAQQVAQAAPAPTSKGFSVSIYKISVRGGGIHFQDDTISGTFSKNIENLDLNLYLSLPTSVKFNLKSDIPGSSTINIRLAGEFKIPKQQLLAKASIQNFSPKDFSAYYQDLKMNISEGLINALLNLEYKDDTVSAGIAAQGKNLVISKEINLFKLNSELKADIQYGVIDKQLKFSGKAVISDSKATSLAFAGGINDIKGEVNFNNAGITADSLSANIWGVPVVTQVKLINFDSPILTINTVSSLDLALIQNVLKDKFQSSFPGTIKGQGNLSLILQSITTPKKTFQLTAYLDILNAILKLEKIPSPINEIKGRLEFSKNQLKWPELAFKYLDIPYKTSGVLVDFKTPQVQLQLSSPQLSLESIFAVNNKLINLSKFSGRYLDSEFSLAGNIDTTNPPSLKTDLSGSLNIRLGDMQQVFKKFSGQLENAKLGGNMHLRFVLNGNVNDFKSCAVQVELSSSDISAYGLKAKDFQLTYNQANGLIDIPVIHLSIYEGTMEASAKMNLASANLPYWVNVDIQGVKIEKLKLDTAAKKQDISGTLRGQIKINGFSDDISKLSGAGNIFITDGKLWELNLFKGLGSLLFASDFASIIFQEGYCGFTIQDKYFFTDSLRLKSNIASLIGSAKIGFDSSIDASLNVEILDEFIPLTGTFKDVTTAIIGQAKKFGVIKISGTLNEPKYKFKTAVADIIKGLKNAIFGK